MATVAGPYAPRHPSPSRRPSHAARKQTQPSYVSSAASSASSDPVKSIPDPYYGHEETAKICAKFISALFSCPDLPPATSATGAQPPPPSPALAHFIGYALHRTRLHSCVTFTALYLLSRLKSRFPAARGSSGHRLFISAFMIASKVVCDDTYSNKSWCVVGQGMFSLKEINQMEREMCGYLEWQLNFDPADLAAFEATTRKEYRSGPQRPVPPPIVTTPRYKFAPPNANPNPLTPPPSPPSAVPESSHSPSPSPASSGILTPPSAGEHDASVAIVAGGHSAPFAPAPAPAKTAAPPAAFAFAAPAVW